MDNEFESLNIKNQMDEYLKNGGDYRSGEYADMAADYDRARTDEILEVLEDPEKSNQRAMRQDIIDRNRALHNNENVAIANLRNANSNKNESMQARLKNAGNNAIANKAANTIANDGKPSLDFKNKDNQQKNDSKDKKSSPNMSNAQRRMLQKELAASGVPKPISKLLTNTKAGQQLLDKASKRALNTMPGGKMVSLANKLRERAAKKRQEAQDEEVTDISATSDKKTLKIAAIGVAAVAVFAVISCLFVVIPYSVANLLSMGFADDIEAHLDEMDEGLDDSALDDTLEGAEGLVGFAGDIFISDNSDSNIIMIAKRKGNESVEEDLSEFYSSITTYTAKYDETMVYTFFYKLHYIEVAYKNNYSVNIDMPLLMATLTAQADDMGFVFASNIANYDISSKESNPLFKYDYDWSNYKTNVEDSSHDIELLVQNMVSKQVKEACITSEGKETDSNILKDSEIGSRVLECKNGETYKTTELGYRIDRDKYEEFLKKFFEEKLYINEAKEPEGGNAYTPPSSGNQGQDVPKTPSGSSSFASAITELAYQEAAAVNVGGHKYRNAYGAQTHWCAIFVWWLSANTTINGVSVYPDLVPFRSASTGEYMRLFMDSNRSNIHFYYNDQCSYYTGKNGVGYTYTPKPGDYVFVDNRPNVAWTRYNDVQDHTAIVVGYSNGVIYTVEGNLSGNSYDWINTSKVFRMSRSLSQCQVIGFGSWY